MGTGIVLLEKYIIFGLTEDKLLQVTLSIIKSFPLAENYNKLVIALKL